MAGDPCDNLEEGASTDRIRPDLRRTSNPCGQANSVFLHIEYLIDVLVAQPKGSIGIIGLFALG